MLTETISTAREAVGDCDILVRGDAAFGNSVVINAAINAGARFSMVINKDAAVNRAIAAISDDAWTPVRYADITHRGHAVIETVFSDLIDGPLAHLPSGSFAANSAWAICAAMTHNLLRAAATLAGRRHAPARGAILRRQLVSVPAQLVKPQGRPVLRLPAH